MGLLLTCPLMTAYFCPLVCPSVYEGGRVPGGRVSHSSVGVKVAPGIIGGVVRVAKWGRVKLVKTNLSNGRMREVMVLLSTGCVRSWFAYRNAQLPLPV